MIYLIIQLGTFQMSWKNQFYLILQTFSKLLRIVSSKRKSYLILICFTVLVEKQKMNFKNCIALNVICSFALRGYQKINIGVKKMARTIHYNLSMIFGSISSKTFTQRTGLNFKKFQTKKSFKLKKFFPKLKLSFFIKNLNLLIKKILRNIQIGSNLK